jgi:hypothetical protein
MNWLELCVNDRNSRDGYGNRGGNRNDDNRSLVHVGKINKRGNP